MNKRVFAIVMTIIVIVIAMIGYVVYKSNNINRNNNNEGVNEQEKNANLAEIEDIPNKEKKILVVYYSAQNHTKIVAEKIANNLNADIFEIVPEDEYTSEDLNWSNSNSRVSKEHSDESLRNVKLKNTDVNNWKSYDIVLIGYPIWWGVAAWPVNNFVKANNFDGKTVIPFCTSASSGLGQSGKLLEKEANSGNWQDGHRFSSSETDSDIKLFTDGIK